MGVTTRLVLTLLAIAVVHRASGFVRASELDAQTNQFTRADAVDRVSTSVLLIQATETYESTAATEGGPKQTQMFTHSSGGTGFLIDTEGHIATAAHVIDEAQFRADIEESERKENRSVVPGSFKAFKIVVSAVWPVLDLPSGAAIFQNSLASFDATVLKENADHDVAILLAPGLKFEKNQYGSTLPLLYYSHGIIRHPTVAELQTRKPRPGESVSASGFPAFLDKNGGPRQIPVVYTESGIISAVNISYANDFYVYSANLRITHGESGGPVFNDSDGRVVGLVHGFYNPVEGGNSSETIVIPISEVLKLLPPSSPN